MRKASVPEFRPVSTTRLTLDLHWYYYGTAPVLLRYLRLRYRSRAGAIREQQACDTLGRGRFDAAGRRQSLTNALSRRKAAVFRRCLFAIIYALTKRHPIADQRYDAEALVSFRRDYGGTAARSAGMGPEIGGG